MAQSLVTKYVDEALDQLRREDLMRFPGGLPKAMLDSTIAPENDWVGWKAIPSTVTATDLDTLEKEIGLAFPPLYRKFLGYRHFLALTEVGVSFTRHLSDSWGNELRKSYFYSWDQSRILDIGLIPFGSESLMDAGPVCFDTRRRNSDGDCPVVFWDHEWVGSEKEIALLFSSSAKMFECLSFVATSDLNFVCHDSDYDDASMLPEKKRILKEFLNIDPLGAGGAAKGYWTCWGVAPDDV